MAQTCVKGVPIMTSLSVKFSQALDRGRRNVRAPDSREALLASLLRKRATAHAIGAEELEALLRNQILWALPMRNAAAEAVATDRHSDE